MRHPPAVPEAYWALIPGGGEPCPNEGRFSFDSWLARTAWRCTGAGFPTMPMRAMLKCMPGPLAANRAKHRELPRV